MTFRSRAGGLAQVFKGIPPERLIYESTLVGQAKLLSERVSKKFKRIRRFSDSISVAPPAEPRGEKKLFFL